MVRRPHFGHPSPSLSKFTTSCNTVSSWFRCLSILTNFPNCFLFPIIGTHTTRRRRTSAEYVSNPFRQEQPSEGAAFAERFLSKLPGTPIRTQAYFSNAGTRCDLVLVGTSPRRGIASGHQRIAMTKTGYVNCERNGQHGRTPRRKRDCLR